MELEDPDGELSGEGSRVRFIEARAEADLPRDAIVRLVNEAFGVGVSRKAR